MEITSDHNELLEKFFETQKELHELELDSYRFLHCSYQRGDANILNRHEKTNEYFIEKDPHFSPTGNLNSKESFYEQQKEDMSSNLSEKSASEDELPIKKVCLQSAVKAVTKPQSKRDFISKQNLNKKVRSRNSRMFGMLQNTLRKFHDDAVKRKPQDLKRIAVELKVEAAKEDEERRMIKEETDLNLKIKEKKLQLNCLEQMLDITKSFHTWKCNMKNSRNFIMTETEPRIYYLPASHNLKTLKKLRQTKLEISENIAEQEKEVRNKVAMIMESFEAGSFGYDNKNDGT